MITRYFVPIYPDRTQSDRYRFDHYRLDDQTLIAIFGDGYEKPSVYPTLADLLVAGERDYRERVREVSKRSLTR